MRDTHYARGFQTCLEAKIDIDFGFGSLVYNTPTDLYGYPYNHRIFYKNKTKIIVYKFSFVYTYICIPSRV